MGFLFKCFFWFMVVVLTWHFLTRKYLNPYKLTMVFGKKGSGKSTLMVRMAYEYLASGWTVFCTEKLDGCIHIDYNDIGFKKIPPESLLLVDEVGMIWDNRNFKNFKPEVRDWFKLQRHYKVKVVLFSQTFDIDKKLRDLTDDMFLCTNVLRVFSWAILGTSATIAVPTEVRSEISSVIVFSSIEDSSRFIYPRLTPDDIENMENAVENSQGQEGSQDRAAGYQAPILLDHGHEKVDHFRQCFEHINDLQSI